VARDLRANGSDSRHGCAGAVIAVVYVVYPWSGHGSADTTIQKFTSNVRVAPDGIQANAIVAVVPAIGQLTGSGTVSPSGALNFNMVASLSSTGAVGERWQLFPACKESLAVQVAAERQRFRLPFRAQPRIPSSFQCRCHSGLSGNRNC